MTGWSQNWSKIIKGVSRIWTLMSAGNEYYKLVFHFMLIGQDVVISIILSYNLQLDANVLAKLCMLIYS